MPVTVDINLEITEVDRGPFGMVPFGGSANLHTELLCLYLVQVTWTARENNDLTKISPKSTASRPQAGSIMLNMQDL